MINKNLKVVKKWRKDPESVSVEELKANAASAFDAYSVDVNNDELRLVADAAGAAHNHSITDGGLAEIYGSYADDAFNAAV
jgi:hypothetical protein